MSESPIHGDTDTETPLARTVDMKFEFIVLPVANVDRAKAFYAALGWKLDMDFVRGDDFRVVQFTPTGSFTSIIFGRGITTAAPGSAKGLYLVVSDIEAARSALVTRGVPVSELFHDGGGVFHHPGTEGRVSGLAPQRRSYGTFAAFDDPDGNGWMLQEVTVRLPGHGSEDGTRYSSSIELAGALRRAQGAYGEHEKKTGGRDADPATWVADYMVREQAGQPRPG